MTISGAMSNALSGLTAASRGIEVVSSNVANARTLGYGRRELAISPMVLAGAGGGVRIDGVRRLVDQGVLSDLRKADATVAGQETRLGFNTRLAGQIGAPGEDGSLSARIATLQAALTEAAARPDSSVRLSAVLSAAQDIATQLNSASDEVQAARLQADQQVGRTVGVLNDQLVQVRDLNVMIRTLNTSGRDATSVIDQRQTLIDNIARAVPLSEIQRPNGMVALVSAGGAVLLDGAPARLNFFGVGFITPDMTIASGALSGLTLNGQAVALQDGGLLSGGELAALFAVRDQAAPEAQAMLDSLARDLATRLGDPSVDPTIGLGDAGLYIDGTGPAVPANELGLAQRLKVNPGVDPAQGGADWRLRTGLYAAAPNAAGDGTLLSAMADALASPRLPGSGPFGGVARSSGSLADEAIAQTAGAGQGLERVLTYATARADTLLQTHLQDGVDTDAELQNLLTLQQAYSANARVVSTLDQLMQTLLGI